LKGPIFIAGFLIILLTSCSGSSIKDKPISSKSLEASIKFIDSDTVYYNAPTSQQHANYFAELVQNNPSVTTLIINSGGGDVFGGMSIGYIVYDKKLNVIVRELCASSCANYIVTASPSVTVEKGGLLGWHGSSMQLLYNQPKTLWAKFIALFTQQVTIDQIADLKDKEKAFFNKIGVNQIVTVLGMIPDFIDSRDSPLFSYDKETQKRLGLSINYEDNKPVELSKSGKKVVQVFTISKDDLNRFIQEHNKVLAKRKW
jgi:hypothetical protein